LQRGERLRLVARSLAVRRRSRRPLTRFRSRGNGDRFASYWRSDFACHRCRRRGCNCRTIEVERADFGFAPRFFRSHRHVTWGSRRGRGCVCTRRLWLARFLVLPGCLEVASDLRLERCLRRTRLVDLARRRRWRRERALIAGDVGAFVEITTRFVCTDFADDTGCGSRTGAIAIATTFATTATTTATTARAAPGALTAFALGALRTLRFRDRSRRTFRAQFRCPCCDDRRCRDCCCGCLA